jgi:4-amino-4-deoxy-L-arabinose transferase-like glycosyltransferase
LSGGAIALFVGLAAVRVGLLLSSQNALSGDEATVGVVARHILSQGERPVFAYGADYNGGAALTAYIGAALFALFGAGETVLKTIPLAYSLAAVVVVYLFVRSAEGEAAGIWAALLYGTSVSLLKWNFDARGGYAECQLLVPVTLWVLWARVLSGGPFEAALVGLLCGFGTYVLQMFAPVGVTSFAYIGLGDRRLRKWAAMAGGCLVGLLPVLLRGAPAGAVGFSPGVSGRTLLAAPFKIFETLTRLLPGLFSYENFEGYPPLRAFPNLLEYGLLLFGATVIVFRRPSWQGPEAGNRRSATALWAAYALIYLLLFSLHPLASHSPRYLLFLVPAFSVLTAVGVRRALEKTSPPALRALGAVLVALVLVERGYETLRLSRDDRIFGPDGPSSPRTADEVIRAVEERGITRVVTEDWDLGWRIVFKTGERIQTSHNLNNLHQPPPLAVVVTARSEDDQRVRDLLEKRGSVFERLTIADKAVYAVTVGPG